MGDDTDSLSPDDWNYRNDERAEPGQLESLAAILSIGIGTVLSILYIFSGEPATGLVALVIGWGLPLLLTESGRKTLSHMMSEIDEGRSSSASQHQQQTGRSRSKQICSDCGWQNAHDNNFCHDCGAELGKGSDDTNIESAENSRDE